MPNVKVFSIFILDANLFRKKNNIEYLQIVWMILLNSCVVCGWGRSAFSTDFSSTKTSGCPGVIAMVVVRDTVEGVE